MMKATFLLAAFCLTLGTLTAESADTAAIVEVVDRAYVQGVHLDADAAKMRSGMHESFVMFVKTEEGLNQLTRDAWIARLKPRAASDPRPDVKAKIAVLDQTGDAAVVKVDIFRGGKQIFTDYISLYRFPDGWKLVGKTFHRH
ncbi:MAG TPA: nuclear transport factor 2 family protein [Thermoanaerobaculia bacterium]|nr:nuclear transport factor 2 family protein [Thermoanaerobaculia bacterium]